MGVGSGVLFRARLLAVASLGVGFLGSGCDDSQTVGNPDGRGRDSGKLDIARQDGATPDQRGPGQDAGPPDIANPDGPKWDTSKKDQEKPDTAHPDTAKPGISKLDIATSDQGGTVPGTWVTIPAGTFMMGSPTSEPCRVLKHALRSQRAPR
jgi:hypothetical protein